MASKSIPCFSTLLSGLSTIPGYIPPQFIPTYDETVFLPGIKVQEDRSNSFLPSLFYPFSNQYDERKNEIEETNLGLFRSSSSASSASSTSSSSSSSSSHQHHDVRINIVEVPKSSSLATSSKEKFCSSSPNHERKKTQKKSEKRHISRSPTPKFGEAIPNQATPILVSTPSLATTSPVSSPSQPSIIIDGKIKCEWEGCGQLFTLKRNMKSHLKLHSGEKPFICTHLKCKRAFATAGNLKAHMRIHTGERPYTCRFEGCGKSFAEDGSLRKHTRTHTGERPYSCDLCKKQFSQSCHLKRHTLTHLC